jgi:endonuclease/exonuclease/phosphatase family metal-dependent hydrolase
VQGVPAGRSAVPGRCSVGSGDRIVTFLRRAAILWIAAVVALVFFQTALPQRTGVLALTEVLEPYIVLSALVVAPLTISRPRLPGAVTAFVLLTVVFARYGPGLITGPRTDRPAALTVTAWNVEAGENGGGRVLSGLAGVTSDLIGLEELQPAMADAVTNDAEIAAAYPYRALSPDSSVLGVGLLSRYPILEQSYSLTSQPRSTSAPPFMRALVSVRGGSPVAVFVVHPLPGRFQSLLGVPVAIDTSDRDAGITTIRDEVNTDLARGNPVIVMGDFNTTPREPAYLDLSSGLNDARQAGSYPGLTWRWDPFKSLPFGLLRIDYVLATLEPLNYGVRCTALSDHCLVTAGLARSDNLL